MEQLEVNNMPPDCNWLLKEITKIKYQQILTTQYVLSNVWKEMAVFAKPPFYFSLKGVKEKSADKSFQKDRSDKNISLWCWQHE